MSDVPPPIDEILGQFFVRRLATLHGLRRQRVDDVADRLWRCLDDEGPALLGDDERTLLEYEREFTPEFAFAACMTAPQLLAVLLRFVSDDWLPEHREDRRVQLRTTDALLDFLVEYRLLPRREAALPLLQVQVAILAAKAAIR